MFVFCKPDLNSGLSSGLSGSVPCPRNPSSYSQGELARFKYLLQMSFLPRPISFSAGTMLYQGLTLPFLKGWELLSAAAQQPVLFSPKILENRSPTWWLFPVPFPFYSVTKQCSEFLPLIYLHWRKQGKLRHGHLGYFLAGFRGVITSNVRFFLLAWPGQPISRCLANTPVLGISRADGLECGLRHS